MTVRCDRCGEELLGAVNRCWRCGQAFAATPDSSERPPISAVVPAEAAEAALGPAPQQLAPTQSHRQDRAAGANASTLGAAPGDAVPPPARTAPAGLAVGSIVLGLFAAGVALGTPAPYFGALIGIPGLLMGVWSLAGGWRRPALAGLLLCCLALLVGGSRSVFQAYQAIHGRAPFADGIEETLSDDERQQLGY